LFFFRYCTIQLTVKTTVMSSLKNIITLFIVAMLVFACEKDSNSPDEDRVVELTGYVQKGPYNNGTSIQISELTEDLIQTGKTFSSQIIDNTGTFELRSLQLSSDFVKLQANGFYFNEVRGENSVAQLTLHAISDLTDKTNLNINVLSHLEKPRVEYLLSEGKSFEEAKKQAQMEILSVFEIEKPDIAFSEQLDISQNGEDNGILLAVSVILQGYRNVSELSELMANIITDMHQDGTLDTEELKTSLINHASILNLSDVRQNLETKYAQMNMEHNLPDFETYVHQFIENTDFEITSLVTYPEFSDYGENILYEDKNTFQAGDNYSMAANIPLGGSLKIVLSGGKWGFFVSPNGPVNWKVSTYNYTQNEQSFSSMESGKRSDLVIRFDRSQPQDSIMMYYYINGSKLPNNTKVLYINGSETFTDTTEVY
jgi:hypothetical protein